MTRPTRETTEGRAYLALQARARELGRGTAEMLLLYALERFVARLAASAIADRMVLKGGVLMAAFGQRRPTRDVDLLALRMDNEPEQLAAAVREVASLDLEDGIHFDTDAMRVGTIREGTQYAGVRVGLGAALATARMALHVDINVGDPVDPPPAPTALPSLLGGEPIPVLAYPVEMVIAEKLVTVIERGGLNTRWRDFADLLQLRDRMTPEIATVTAVLRVAAHRQVALAPFHEVRAQFAASAQPRWAAWRRKQGLTALMPESFEEVLDALEPLADALLTLATQDKASDSNLDPDR